LAYREALAREPSLTEAAVELKALGCRVDGNWAPDTGYPPAHRQSKRKRIGLGRISRADRARDLGQWQLAARLYREALDRNPERQSIWVQYGHVLKQLGELPEAENAYRHALPGNPDAAQVYLYLGDVLKLRGERDRAEASYLRAFARDASLHQALRGLEELGWETPRLNELRMLAAEQTSGLGIP
jgi:tetratricopeptide (TPR) repeat protein